MPWVDWMLSPLSQSMGRKENDMALAQSVLHMLHSTCISATQPVYITLAADQKKKVLATRDIEPGTLLLPPCNPKSRRLLEKSSHPQGVPIKIRRHGYNAQTGVTEEGEANVYYIHPEFKAPEETDPSGEPADGAKVWNYQGGETMHPFWAVRRLTAQQMLHESPCLVGNCVLAAELECRVRGLLPSFPGLAVSCCGGDDADE